MSLDRAKLDDIIDLASRILGPRGFEVIEAEWVGGDRILRIYIDRQAQSSDVDGKSVDLDACVDASRQLEDVTDLDDMIPGPYSLEVSSPGVERPLRTRAHFEQHLGQEIQVRLGDKSLPRRKGKGKVLRVGGDSGEDAEVTLETTQGEWTFPLRALQKAHLVYDWDAASR